MLSSGPVGGSTALSWRRIAERWTSRRMSGPACSATAPSTQAISSPTHAVSTAPSAPSTAAKAGDRNLARSRAPTPSKPAASTPPATIAPISANAGAHCDSRPPSSTSGATRVPSQAPAAKPTSASTPEMNPCAQPNSAEQHDRADDHPVDAGQASERTRTLATARRMAERRSNGRRPAPVTRRRMRLRRLAPLLVPRRRVRSLGGLVVGGRHEPAERRLADALRAGLGARRLRGDVRDAHARGAEAAARSRASRAPTGDAATTATTAPLRARGRARTPRDDTVTVPIARAARGSSATSHRTRHAPDRRGRRRRAGDRVGAAPRVPGPARRARS